MAKENNFNPTAFKQNLPEEVIPGSFRCKGCHEISTGYIFQEKLCKSCALELIKYSRKAQKHIDNLRPAYCFDNLEMKIVSNKPRLKQNDYKYIQFIERNKEVTIGQIAFEFGVTKRTVWSSVYRYKEIGLVEVIREKFVGNRITKVYGIKGENNAKN